jgi:hypothetical protein
MKLFWSLLLIVVVFGVYADVRPQTNNVSSPAPRDNEIGLPQYPQSAYLPESTERLLETKAPTWLAARVYQTEDSIKDGTKYFREQGEKAKKSAGENQYLKQLLRDNWKITDGRVSLVSAVFGVGKDLTTHGAKEEAKTSFGVILLDDDSFVRVQLMSPHPSDSNNNTLVPGTMIVMIRERIPTPAEVAASAVAEKPYTGREVTRKIRILSKPEPESVPGIYGKVVLKAVMGSSATVTHIVVVSGVPGLTERAINAARKIKFEPAIKDGRYVSQWVQLEYNFY